MDIPEDIDAFTAPIKDRQLGDLVAKMWAANRAARNEHVAKGGSFCPRCKCWLKAGQVCHCKPSAPVQTPLKPPEIAPLEAAQKRIALITKGLEKKPWLTLKDVQRKLPDATWNDFATARSNLVERYRKEAWVIMDTLEAGAPLTPELRCLCEQLVATAHGRTFESCGQYLVKSALKPKLAEAYLTNKACPWDNGGKQA
ncbi:MAG: hypothetical protein Q4F00_14090 [bacterium]|nr:hypothetical protein [bacterium]